VRIAGGLEGDFSGDKERIRVPRRGVDGAAQEQGTRFGAQTDVHHLIRVQKRALSIASSSGFRSEGMVTIGDRFHSLRCLPFLLPSIPFLVACDCVSSISCSSACDYWILSLSTYLAGCLIDVRLSSLFVGSLFPAGTVQEQCYTREMIVITDGNIETNKTIKHHE
jgi:hypothetical protein